MKSLSRYPDRWSDSSAVGDEMLNKGATVAEGDASSRITESTWRLAKNTGGRARAENAKRLKEPEAESKRLKNIAGPSRPSFQAVVRLAILQAAPAWRRSPPTGVQGCSAGGARIADQHFDQHFCSKTSFGTPQPW